MLEAGLIRLETSKAGIVGVLKIGGKVQCFTLEKTYLDNQKNISSIPAGSYICKSIFSQRFKNTFEVTAVPGRAGILFHAGNTTKDTEGCILLGNKIGAIAGVRAVLESRIAVAGFLETLEGTKVFRLKITEKY